MSVSSSSGASPREHIPFLDFDYVVEPDVILVLECILVPCLFHFRATTLGQIHGESGTMA
jgi:hypothetical protein